MTDDLDRELEELLQPQPAPPVVEVRCNSCGDAYGEHPDGGHCTAVKGGWSSPARAVPCPCPGFQWVDPGGPPVGSYRDRPAPIARR